MLTLQPFAFLLVELGRVGAAIEQDQRVDIECVGGIGLQLLAVGQLLRVRRVFHAFEVVAHVSTEIAKELAH